MKNKYLLSALFVSASFASACGGSSKDVSEPGKNVTEDCTPGETKAAEDGCNSCQCSETGWSCTEMACGDGEASNTGDNAQDGTSNTGDACEVGATKIGECDNTCNCTEMGWVCTMKGCADESGAPSLGE